jgi:Uma2 family endonuclease
MVIIKEMATQPVPRMTEEEYLRIERAATYKSEFVGGEMFAMSGGTLWHSQLAANWIAHLGNQLRGGPCRVFTSDARVRTTVSGSYLYPDISVAYGEPLRDMDVDILISPKTVVELLSPSTADYDRGKKFELYREIPSLEEYVLTHSDAPHVEHFARQADASWIFREYKGLESSLRLVSLGCEIGMADIYERIFLT